MNTFNAFDIVGIAGVSLILFGFYRTSIGKWTSKSFWYELDNLIGASLLIVYSLHHTAYISVIMDAIWVIVAIRGISSFRERRQAHKRKRRR